MSARGFAKPASPRMQILLDGRPLYDPYRGGFDLELHPIFLENIERIEVIRGSGGVIWGVNAMNGVINIITKKAADTQGGLLYGGFGNRATQQGLLRIGGSDGKMDWRGTVGAFHDNGLGSAGGEHTKDYFQAFQTTGRADMRLDEDTTLFLSGGHKHSTTGWGNTAPKQRHRAQHTNLIWKKDLGDNESVQILWGQTFYKRTTSDSWNLRTQEDIVEFQHNFVHDDIHNIVWGADYTRDTFTSSPTGHVEDTRPGSFSNDQASAFIEDEITLRDNLWLTIGYRGHHNELTNFDWAGRLALVWEAAPKHFLRAAVSKSFKRPIMHEMFAYVNKTGTVSVVGNDGLRNERLISYELGYRGQIRDNLELNVEGFINKHKDLIGQVGGAIDFSNLRYDITTYGIETAIDWKPKDWWLVRAFHVYEHQTDENRININNAANGKVAVWTVPQHKVGLTNRFYLDDTTTLNTQVFWSDTFFDRSATPNRIKPYCRLDIRLAKRFLNDNAELAFGVTNLNNPQHYEGSSDLSEVPRIVYFQFFYNF